MIEFRHVSKTYDGRTPAIEGLDLQIARGEFLVLLGASGSGKSTLLRMINRMEVPTCGQVLLDGQDTAAIPVRELRLRMGYAIQSVGLFPHWTVARNIACVPQLLGWPAARIEARVDALLRLFGLDPLAFRGRYPHQLSGGQQQRIGVARALAADPQVLLMDEPFGALDPVIRASLQAEMQRVHAASGTTIVMVTHDVDEALRLATRIVLLDRGRILQAATPTALLAQPASDAVIDFLGRGGIGLRLLSLQRAGDLARAAPPQAGGALPADTSLREALSLLAMQRLPSINLTAADGSHAGVLHAADVFAGAGAARG